jgi:hypothetical protein
MLVAEQMIVLDVQTLTLTLLVQTTVNLVLLDISEELLKVLLVLLEPAMLLVLHVLT